MQRAAYALCSLFMMLAALAARADTVVVSADRMIDVIAGRVLEHPQVTITDGRISGVGPQDTPVPAGARRVDLPGITLLPGPIDMHVHLTSDPHLSGYRQLAFTDNFWTVVGTTNARRTLEAGFSTVRNVGSQNYDEVALKQAIEQGYVPGPRIVPATYAIGATGGHISAHTPAVADGPEALRALVRKLPARGNPGRNVTAAEALGRPNDVGAIAVGRYGDLIGVAGDPLSDVAVLQSVSFVMKGGELIKRPTPH